MNGGLISIVFMGIINQQTSLGGTTFYGFFHMFLFHFNGPIAALITGFGDGPTGAEQTFARPHSRGQVKASGQTDGWIRMDELTRPGLGDLHAISPMRYTRWCPIVS